VTPLAPQHADSAQRDRSKQRLANRRALRAALVNSNLRPDRHCAAPAHRELSRQRQEQQRAVHALQAQLKVQVVVAHAPRVPQEHLRILQGDRRAIHAPLGLQAEWERLSATTWRRLAALRGLRRSVRREPVPRAQRDSDLTQPIQRANSVRREATRLPKGALSVSPAQQEDLAAERELRRVPPARREPSQQLTALERVPRAPHER
jgi:hypothetical protein